MASTFGAAFDKLPFLTQRGIFEALSLRKRNYGRALKGEYSRDTKVCIIGDTPGPGRPNDPNYHHTPFYSTKNSSLWLNQQLVEAGIDENKLLWFNAVLATGESLERNHAHALDAMGVKFVVLGGNAEGWLQNVKPTPEYIKVFHPQYAKRFRAKEPYALIQHLKELT